jgi:type II secretory pathway pseudopilin PulG
MRTGESAGFTYLGVLILLALGSAMLAGAGERTQQALQRERERELVFRGQQIRQAIERYQQASPDGRLPATWEELLSDTRSGTPVHHLRRRYVDPFTGRFDWVEMRDAGAGIKGVHSRVTLPSLLHKAGSSSVGPGGGAQGRLSDMKFAVDSAKP